MEAAAEGVQDRLVKNQLTLDMRVASNIGSFTADDRRLRQILFNLLVQRRRLLAGRRDRHASPQNGGQKPSCSPSPTTVPAFRRKPRTKCSSGSKPIRADRSIVGQAWGSSLVRSFVELHGGTVDIDSVLGQGTTVTCSFPAVQELKQTAA